MKNVLIILIISLVSFKCEFTNKKSNQTKMKVVTSEYTDSINFVKKVNIVNVFFTNGFYDLTQINIFVGNELIDSVYGKTNESIGYFLLAPNYRDIGAVSIPISQIRKTNQIKIKTETEYINFKIPSNKVFNKIFISKDSTIWNVSFENSSEIILLE